MPYHTGDPLMTQAQTSPATEKQPHGYAKQATGFHKKLREGTQSLHDEAESGSFPVRMESKDVARQTFGAFLTQMKHIHAELDPAYKAAANVDPRFKQIFDDSHLRSHRIEQDLADLNFSGSDAPRPATIDFVTYIKHCIENSPCSLIGVLYVKEGATNGNKFMAKKLRETLGLNDDAAMGYLDPHGKDQRKRWNAFKETLNKLELTDEEQESCVGVAKETFRMFMNISASSE